MVEKRTWVIISLVFTFISLVYIILTYYGITRYISIHIYPMKDYVNNFRILEKACKERVVISITTTPKRIKKISAVISSLLDQTVKVDEIALNIPYKFQNQISESYEVSKELEKTINVYRSGKDYGPMTAIIPTLLREKEANTKIIFLDDDVIYGKDFIETLVDASICPDGIGKAIFVNGWETQLWEKTAPNVICCKSGVLIQPNFVSADIIENVSLDTNPDIWVSGWLHKNKIPFKQVQYKENYSDWGSKSRCRIPITEDEKIKQLNFFH